MAAYLTIQEAQAYFDERLHTMAWNIATSAERPKALLWATRIIDSLAFKGDKNSVYALIQANTDGTPGAEACYRADNQVAIRTANDSQENEFPRGADTTVPDEIEWACAEIAYALLDGIDPDLEMENIAANSHGIGSVRTSWSRSQGPPEHLVNGVPSATAWKYLKPFLRDDNHIRLARVS